MVFNINIFMEKPESESYLVDAIKQLRIPKNRILFLHVKLRDLKMYLDVSYEDLARFILKILQELYHPKTILVPTFTYNFTKTGVYHRIFSRSEVGRFSQEVRRLGVYRTPDPIFSVVDIDNYLEKFEKEIDYTTAFEENSLFHFLNEEDCIIINLGLDKLISTQLHYIERANHVCYRYDKVFNGVVYFDQNTWKHVAYHYYVRNLELNPQWNRKKIKQYLIKCGVLHSFTVDKVEISWASAQSKMKVISQAISEDELFLIK